MSNRKSVYILAGSLRSVWRFPLRSGLLLLSAMLGVGGVTSAINYAEDGRLKALNQIRLMGTNILLVTPQPSRAVGGRARTGTIVTTLVEQDYTAIQHELPDIQRSSATAAGTFLIKAGDLSKNNCPVIGVEPDYFRIRNWPVRDGAVFDSTDARHASRLVLLGSTVARDLFAESSPVGQRVLINRVPFEVTGVLAERGQSLEAGNGDNQAIHPTDHRDASLDERKLLLWPDLRARGLGPHGRGCASHPRDLDSPPPQARDFTRGLSNSKSGVADRYRVSGCGKTRVPSAMGGV